MKQKNVKWTYLHKIAKKLEMRFPTQFQICTSIERQNHWTSIQIQKHKYPNSMFFWPKIHGPMFYSRYYWCYISIYPCISCNKISIFVNTFRTNNISVITCSRINYFVKKWQNICVHVVHKQGDQIGRIFVSWPIVYSCFGQFFTISARVQIFVHYFHRKKVFKIIFFTKNCFCYLHSGWYFYKIIWSPWGPHW
jgi:hypothetical protein